MKFKSDILFEDFPCMLCEEFDEGHQSFTSWEDFLFRVKYFLHKDTLPQYVFGAVKQGMNVFVDMSQIIKVPWEELEKYI